MEPSISPRWRSWPLSDLVRTCPDCREDHGRPGSPARQIRITPLLSISSPSPGGSGRTYVDNGAHRGVMLRRDGGPAICFCRRRHLHAHCLLYRLSANMQALIGCQAGAAGGEVRADRGTMSASRRFAAHLLPHWATSCCCSQILCYVTPHLPRILADERGHFQSSADREISLPLGVGRRCFTFDHCLSVGTLRAGCCRSRCRCLHEPCRRCL